MAYPYASATILHLSLSPPTTMTVLSLYWSISAKGVWLCTNMLVSIATPNLLLRSATRSDSCFPPPFVRRIKGICCDWRYERALLARGNGSALRSSTPSILTAVSCGGSQRPRSCNSTRTRTRIQELWTTPRQSAAPAAAAYGSRSFEAASMFAEEPTFLQCMSLR
jgi:hypothetical protein